MRRTTDALYHTARSNLRGDLKPNNRPSKSKADMSEVQGARPEPLLLNRHAVHIGDLTALPSALLQCLRKLAHKDRGHLRLAMLHMQKPKEVPHA